MIQKKEQKKGRTIVRPYIDKLPLKLIPRISSWSLTYFLSLENK